MSKGDLIHTVPVELHTDALGERVPLYTNSPTQWWASHGMVLRVLVGSGVHGTAIYGMDDRDEMGVCLEPTATTVGLNRFEHYEFRTQPQGQRSGPGDLDLIVYTARKYLRLAMAGNPTTLLPLFVPDEHVCFINDAGRELREGVDWIVSKLAADKFAGYLHGQRQGLLGERAGARHQGRADIIERFGFDTKFAMHMVRLGLQGVELLETGRITLPIPEPHLKWLRELRRGQHTKEEALAWAEKLEAEIWRLKDRSRLPDKPDYAKANMWLENAHLQFWRQEWASRD